MNTELHRDDTVQLALFRIGTQLCGADLAQVHGIDGRGTPQSSVIGTTQSHRQLRTRDAKGHVSTIGIDAFIGTVRVSGRSLRPVSRLARAHPCVIGVLDTAHEDSLARLFGESGMLLDLARIFEVPASTASVP